MRRAWMVAVMLAACASSEDEGEPPPLPLPARDAGSGSQPDGSDSAPTPTLDGGADTGADAGLATAPFEERLVLRFETDAPDGLQANGVWRDLSKAAHAVTLASGTPTIEFSGGAGAKAMVFTAAGPIFDVADNADLQFGATDDFFVVARVTVTAPLEASGCTFRYLFAKYAADGATSATLRICAQDPKRDLTGALKLGAPEATVTVPTSLTSTYDVVSLGRNASGTRLETFAAGASLEKTISPIDVSAPGNAFVVGGYRYQGTGGPSNSWIGKVNRMYVYHAPGGTFTKPDFDAIRSFVKSAAPLP